MRFTNIPGHSKLKERLATNIDEGRVPHAQLFVGEDGSGVLPLAIAYASTYFVRISKVRIRVENADLVKTLPHSTTRICISRFPLS